MALAPRQALLTNLEPPGSRISPWSLSPIRKNFFKRSLCAVRDDSSIKRHTVPGGGLLQEREKAIHQPRGEPRIQDPPPTPGRAPGPPAQEGSGLRGVASLTGGGPRGRKSGSVFCSGKRVPRPRAAAYIIPGH